MITDQGKARQIVYFSLLVLVLYFGLSYSNSYLRGFTTKNASKDSSEHTFGPKQICYRSNGGTFERNYLKKLVVKTINQTSAYQSESDASKLSFISKNYSTLAEFIENTRSAVMSRRLIPNTHSIWTIFHNPPYKDMMLPSCDGLWMEFGVFHGQTLSHIANWKTVFCGNASQPVYGFDTFEGLPTDWRPGYKRGHFRIDNWAALSVPSNTVLVKGLFIDTLPTQLSLIDQQHQCNTPVAFIHIDCDLYEGTRDALFLLESRLVRGSMLVFDELFNYPTYEKYEIKALYEFLSGSGLRLLPLGASVDIDLHPGSNMQPHSFAFVVY